MNYYSSASYKANNAGGINSPTNNELNDQNESEYHHVPDVARYSKSAALLGLASTNLSNNTSSLPLPLSLSLSLQETLGFLDMDHSHNGLLRQVKVNQDQSFGFRRPNFSNIRKSNNRMKGQYHLHGTSSGPNEFVRKLFDMLQVPDYQNIVRWTDTGDSFVVIDTNEFTRTILPRHFKHSNFSSFVRQLNKYDFHKIRANSSDGSSLSQYSGNVWEFKHPDFRLHHKDQIDNIRRKAVTSRKQQFPVMRDYLMDSPYHFKDENSAISEKISRLESELKSMRAVQMDLTTEFQELLEHHTNTQQQLSLLQTQQKCLTDVLQQLILLKSRECENDSTYTNLLSLLGQTTPFHQVTPPPLPIRHSDPARLSPPYLVLLAENDVTCLDVCHQLLLQYGCEVDVVANNGVEVMKRVQANTYDLILVGMAVPQLDSMSVLSLIHNFNVSTPIIVMTSSMVGSSSMDFQTYYQYRGVTDVLHKPVTRESLGQILNVYLQRRNEVSSTASGKRRSGDATIILPPPSYAFQ